MRGWKDNLSEFINYGLDTFPFPFSAMGLMILIVPAFVYYVLKDLVGGTGD